MSRIVVTGRIPQPALDSLREAGHDLVVHDSDETIERAALLDLVAGADAVVTLITATVDEEFLDAAGEQLRVVANIGVGYNNIDVPACTGRGVVVTNTPDVLTETTADTAFALVLMATRRLGEAERLIRSGTPWAFGMNFMLGAGIQGKTLGVVGLGAIGAATARRAKAFGMDITYHNRSRAAAYETELDARRLDLEELLATADVVSLHCPYSEATHHLIDADALAAMKPEAFLVNTSRGPVVDEAALVEALGTGQIAGAGLDVFENEPQVHPGLLDLENAVLIPHLGSATVETRTAMARLAADNADAVLSGREPLTPVS